MAWMLRKPKYGNTKVITESGSFDSKKEARRWRDLQMMEKGGLIKNLRRQVSYTLIPLQRDEEGHLLERSCKYIADFVYTDESGKTVVEDAKGYRTDDYIIKRKLMLKVHGIRIREI